MSDLIRFDVFLNCETIKFLISGWFIRVALMETAGVINVLDCCKSCSGEGCFH